ncbi:hypothetical protein HaLaN_33014, partial [Haematococcus lacustris]
QQQPAQWCGDHPPPASGPPPSSQLPSTSAGLEPAGRLALSLAAGSSAHGSVARGNARQAGALAHAPAGPRGAAGGAAAALGREPALDVVQLLQQAVVVLERWSGSLSLTNAAFLCAALAPHGILPQNPRLGARIVQDTQQELAAMGRTPSSIPTGSTCSDLTQSQTVRGTASAQPAPAAAVPPLVALQLVTRLASGFASLAAAGHPPPPHFVSSLGLAAAAV